MAKICVIMGNFGSLFWDTQSKGTHEASGQRERQANGRAVGGDHLSRVELAISTN